MVYYPGTLLAKTGQIARQRREEASGLADYLLVPAIISTYNLGSLIINQESRLSASSEINPSVTLYVSARGRLLSRDPSAPPALTLRRPNSGQIKKIRGFRGGCFGRSPRPSRGRRCGQRSPLFSVARPTADGLLRPGTTGTTGIAENEWNGMNLQKSQSLVKLASSWDTCHLIVAGPCPVRSCHITSARAAVV